MALNGIDISDHQRGIDISAVNPDFVIVKATEGTGYVSPSCAAQVDASLALGKPTGVYHYVSGGGATAEADYFVDHCLGWNGKILWAIDWEAGDNDAWGNEDYLSEVVARVAARTGKPPLIYASSGSFPWSVARANNCGAWVAQYADMNPSDWDYDPWTDETWSGAVMHQYTSNLRVGGYDGPLDADLFYGDRAAWEKFVGGAASPSWWCVPDGIWGTHTGRRFREVMGVSKDASWKEACRVFQIFLNWGLDAYGHKAAHGGYWVNEKGNDDSATWAAFQAWWNDSHIPAGHKIKVDGVYGTETITAMQHALNNSWAGSKGLALKP